LRPGPVSDCACTGESAPSRRGSFLQAKQWQAIMAVVTQAATSKLVVDESEERPITALPLFGTFGLYAYADGRIMGVDNASSALTLKDPDLPCHGSIFDPSHRLLGAVPRLDASVMTEGSSFVEDFKERHLKAFVPAVVSGLTADWAAMGKWNFDFFKSACGDVDVEVTHDHGKRRWQRLADYLEEVGGRQRKARLPYLRGWYYERDVPALSSDLWKAGDFHDVAFRDWFKKLPRRFHPDFHWLFIGGAGSTTPLHVDPTATHAWLTQISGRKRFVLFAPCDLPLLRNSTGTDLMSLEEIRERGVPSLEAVLEPGDTLFVPAFWAHYVECIDDSVSITWNFLGEQLYPLVRVAFLAHQLGANAREAALAKRKQGSDGPAQDARDSATAANAKEADGLVRNAADSTMAAVTPAPETAAATKGDQPQQLAVRPRAC